MIVGEFSAMDGEQGNPWPWLNGLDTGSNRARVRERLLELERLGYPLALVWPDGPQPNTKAEPPVCDPKINSDTAAGIADYWASAPKP